MKKKKYTKKQTQELNFHNYWGEQTVVDAIDVNQYFTAEAALDFRLAKKLLGDIKGKKILDLGCGLGEASVYFALQGAEVTALDISQKMLQCVEKLAKKYKVREKITLVEAAAEEIPLKTESLDLVFGGNVLHHVDISKVSRETKRVLKKGGRAVFIEPLGYNPIIQIYRKMAGDVRTRMEKPFTFRDIKNLSKDFSYAHHTEQQLFTTLIFVWFFLGERVNPSKVRYWKKIINESEKYEKAFKILNRIDSFILKMPFIRRLCWSTVIELVK